MKTHKFFIKDSPDRIDSHNSYSLISLPTRSDAHSLPRSRLPPIMNLKIEWTPVGTTLNNYVLLGKLYAVKISKRNSTSEQAGMRDDEIQILVKFGQHPNIITVKV